MLTVTVDTCPGVRLVKVAIENVGGAAPVPLSETVCGLPGASLVIVSVPGKDPADGGVNVTSTLQEAAGASVPVQSVDLA